MVGLTTKVFDSLWAAFTLAIYNVFVLEGGSRSSKTHSIIQFWIAWAQKKRSGRVIVARLKSTWLKATVMKDFTDTLKFYNLYDEKNHNKSDRIYTLYGVEFWFIGLDDTQKIHGMRSDAFWINEAIEASKDDFDQLMQRCEGFGILDYNPSEEEHWIYDSVCKRPKAWYSHSTMLDNRLIPKNAKEQILSYEPTEYNYSIGTADKRKWEIYGLGKRAKIEGLVFDIPEITDIWPTTKRHFRGMDLGYTNDVTAIINVSIRDNDLFLDEVCYRTRMLTSDIVSELKKSDTKVWSESADPRMIDEIHLAGINIHPVEKGAGSIMAGIDKMKTMKMYITPQSFNLIKEFKNYTYEQDKNGKWLNKPIDAWNHGIDAVRYVVLMEVLGRSKPTGKSNAKYFH
ncbi:PBSX family phage terminase large subunit [Flavitalea antarctica]